MAKRVIWSKRSLQDKKEIFDYWNEANRNKKYSRKLNEEINKITDLLLLFPNLGRQLENHNARFIVKGDYIIL